MIFLYWNTVTHPNSYKDRLRLWKWIIIDIFYETNFRECNDDHVECKSHCAITKKNGSDFRDIWNTTNLQFIKFYRMQLSIHLSFVWFSDVVLKSNRHNSYAVFWRDVSLCQYVPSQICQKMPSDILSDVLDVIHWTFRPYHQKCLKCWAVFVTTALR